MTPHFRMRIRLSRFSLALALAWMAALPLAQAQTTRASVTTADYIIAVVNTELVTAVEVLQRLERARVEARRGGISLPDDESLRKQAVDALIDERVLVTFARENGPKVDEQELDRAVANVAAQNQLTLAQLRERLKAEGLEYARFRGNLKDQILLERVREREVSSRIRVTDPEIDKFLADASAASSDDAELNIAQVLISVPEGASDSLVTQRRALATQALARVRGGENFAAVALELSEDGNKAVGGEIGMRASKRLPDLFVQATQSLSPGQIAPELVRSGAGFHVLKLVERKDVGPGRVTQTHARHILLRSTDPAAAQANARRLDELRREIEGGGRTFEDVARQVSEDSSAAAGGDLGWASPGNMVPEFEEAMNKLAPGGISPPVLTRFGVHLIQVIERRDTTIEPKALREQARNQLREQKFGQAFDDWAKELRLRAYIEFREPPL